MQDLWIVSDAPTRAAAIRRQLDGIFTVKIVEPGRLGDTQPPPRVLCDVDFSNGSQVASLKAWLGRKPKDGKVVFAVDKASHLQAIQAKALGAMHVLHRPLERKALL